MGWSERGFSAIGFGFLVAAGSCDFVPTSRSTCQAMCEWAVTCHEADRADDFDDVHTACLEATRAADASCSISEAGTQSFAAEQALGPCLSAIDARTDDLACEAFTGSTQERQSATPPAQCIGAGRDASAVFEAARRATEESSAALCARIEGLLCDRTTACIVEAFGGAVPSEVEAALGSPRDACGAAIDGLYTLRCIRDDRYASPETAVNPAREGALICVDDLVTIGCADLYAGRVEPECRAAFETPEELVAVANALATTARAFEDAAAP